MRIALIFFLPLLLLVSCSSETVRRERPSGVLSRDTMVLLLSEAAIFNAKSQHRDTRKKNFKELILSEEKNLFDSLGIDQALFKSSLEYYLADRESMESIYDDAMTLLSTQSASLTASIKEDSSVSASILEHAEKAEMERFNSKVKGTTKP